MKVNFKINDVEYYYDYDEAIRDQNYMINLESDYIRKTHPY